MPELRQSRELLTSVDNWLASVLYGGVIEEVMMRLFLMSLLALIIRKLFARRSEKTPAAVITAANIIAALLFAAGHLPATVSMFGALTPMLLVRCFLLNGAFGVLFGELYRRYGIQYAMLSHALLHIVSKTIWLLFV
ncbi:MAG: CPBP family intramembrane metalloprotease [Ruminococcaceae bacterium]|nr:CPBP family intramembrane metalloprotease [Oscillospiraceae bacterium]